MRPVVISLVLQPPSLGFSQILNCQSGLLCSIEYLLLPSNFFQIEWIIKHDLFFARETMTLLSQALRSQARVA
ncbi:hypothetical protein C8Q70DRAFT_215539 [Cubamyces menziesii]|nr:hypothetical protein C8Q70DRAFT_215539 [Cubamyces menziesii]